MGPGLLNDARDTVNVVWHNHRFIQLHSGKMLWDGKPALLNEESDFVEPYDTVSDSAECRPLPSTPDGQKIGARLRIVITGQTN